MIRLACMAGLAALAVAGCGRDPVGLSPERNEDYVLGMFAAQNCAARSQARAGAVLAELARTGAAVTISSHAPAASDRAISCSGAMPAR
ncbi:hypothetical protein SAMN05421538_101156 [Paracoccus isoporae]|uniref:Lipoprotein n=1 Tax=Paracoccus isoporae TaxID=591205 RepID=A0A1G6T2W1_9RHOB|nr:hypothetical protein [Paracoccus isoporae]SDD22715.1 hypothetical protein SAMN05421538_101156 [Paracoccus isoporae]